MSTNDLKTLAASLDDDVYWLINTVLKRSSSVIRSAGIVSADLDARVLLGHVLRMDWSEIVMNADSPVDRACRAQLDTLIERRIRGEPIAYLIGKREFWGLEFDVDDSTLIPRPDSETIVEAVLRELHHLAGDSKRQLRMLDLGTGSGCLLLALLSELPSALGVGVDCSSDALDIARKNAAKHGLHNRTSFYESDWARNVDGFFNVIVANPPYIAECALESLPRDVYQFEPRSALCGGSDGLEAYRRLAEDVLKLLEPEGLIFVEVGAGQAESARRILFDQSELIFIKSYPDLTGTIRVLAGQKRNIEKGVGKGSTTR